jgi:hypothetical protein
MIAESLTQEIATTLQQFPVLSETTMLELRKQFAGVHFTYCLDDDIHRGKPVYTSEAFNLYLVNSSQHCLCLTNDFDNATGIVVAEVVPEED